jgi:hypothetical protein
VMD